MRLLWAALGWHTTLPAPRLACGGGGKDSGVALSPGPGAFALPPTGLPPTGLLPTGGAPSVTPTDGDQEQQQGAVVVEATVVGEPTIVVEAVTVYGATPAQLAVRAGWRRGKGGSVWGKGGCGRRCERADALYGWGWRAVCIFTPLRAQPSLVSLSAHYLSA